MIITKILIYLQGKGPDGKDLDELVSVVRTDGSTVNVTNTNRAATSPTPVELPQWTIRARQASDAVKTVVANMLTQSPDTLRRLGSAAYLCWREKVITTQQFVKAIEVQISTVPGPFMVTFDQATEADKIEVLLGFWLGIHEQLIARGLKGVVA